MVRRTRAEMEETRATLIATARKVFSEQGYADTSMDDMTAQAGLTRGALYHHFGDKKGLLAAVTAQIDAEMDARLQAISNRCLRRTPTPFPAAATTTWRSGTVSNPRCSSRSSCWPLAGNSSWCADVWPDCRMRSRRSSTQVTATAARFVASTASPCT